MNDLKIRPYQDKDYNSISQMFEDFIDYLVIIDPINRIIKQPEYGKNYLDKTIEEVRDNDGIFLVAEIDNVIVGLGAALIEILSQKDLMEVLPHTPGRITELFVTDQCRGKGIGRKIMEKLENYLKQKGCSSIQIEVFAPNNKTRRVYEKLGYSDRNIDMMKVL